MVLLLLLLLCVCPHLPFGGVCVGGPPLGATPGTHPKSVNGVSCLTDSTPGWEECVKLHV